MSKARIWMHAVVWRMLRHNFCTLCVCHTHTPVHWIVFCCDKFIAPYVCVTPIFLCTELSSVVRSACALRGIECQLCQCCMFAGAEFLEFMRSRWARHNSRAAWTCALTDTQTDACNFKCSPYPGVWSRSLESLQARTWCKIPVISSYCAGSSSLDRLDVRFTFPTIY